MCTIKVFTFSLLFSFSCYNVAAQSDAAKAKELGMAAIKLEDEGKADDALELLAKAKALDPSNYVYSYEMAYCYKVKKEYKQGIAIMQNVVKMSGIREECYQMLGNLYDMDGDSSRALKTYAEGLKVFPNAGQLYLETGNVYFGYEEYNKALPFYEKGIEADPTFSSNYYRATQIYTASSEAIWGMIYGEIFMNLERNSDRTANVSKWLYDTYKANIEIHSKDSMGVHFSKNIIVNVDDITDKHHKFKLPFNMIYEPVMLMSLILTDSINTETLCSMRKKFIEIYFEKNYDTDHPNVLFSYQKSIEKQVLLMPITIGFL